MYVPEISSACYIYNWISIYDLYEKIIRSYQCILNGNTNTEIGSRAEAVQIKESWSYIAARKVEI